MKLKGARNGVARRGAIKHLYPLLWPFIEFISKRYNKDIKDRGI